MRRKEEGIVTEKEKMISGEWYVSADAQLAEERARAKELCERYNATPRADAETREKLLRELFGALGDNPFVEKNIWADYGYNLRAGKNFYVNHDSVFLDSAPITFGDNVFIAPQCGFYTAGHPLDRETRIAGIEFAKPITVGDDVWIGGGVKVMPGVTIGDNVVIGGGSVVVKDIPSDCVAAGNPARVIRTLGGELSRAKGKAKDGNKAGI